MAGPFNLMGSIGIFSGPGSAPTATTASEAAFGAGASDSTTSSGPSLAPTHPAAIALWAGVAAGFGLAWLRYSLPADRRSEFDLVLIMLVLWGPAKGVVKMPLQRLAQEPVTQGPIDKAARAALWVLS